MTYPHRQAGHAPCCPAGWNLARRSAVSSISAAGAAGGGGGGGAGGVQARSEAPRLEAGGPATPRIDVHFHIYPPQMLAEANSLAGQIRGVPGIGDWDAAKAAETLDKDGIGIGVISFASPTLWGAEVESQRRLARLCNDYFAQIVRDHPGRFGLFACLPPPDDVDGTLAEIAYAFDVLHADGVRVMTSYGNEKWLGDAAFSPIWDELSRRKAAVFVHPELACFCQAAPSQNLELPFDTARTAFSLWQAGAFERWPDINFIFSHGGGALPMLISRLNSAGRPGANGERVRDAHTAFRRAYYDTAQSVAPSTVAAILAFADPTRILFGSDKPFGSSAAQAAALAAAIEDAALLRAIEHGNAAALMPGLVAGGR
jgi:6-methylsalicylate decarboxylase